ncbi:MAG: hypothetical protein ACM3VW_04615 [Bacteroidota bacterium]
MSRAFLMTLLVSVLLLAMALPLLAQETADIAIGGGLVARLRDAGSFATVRERAANVDQKLNNVVSNKDTQHPLVLAKLNGKLWTVYAWDIAVVSVMPAEAKANGMTEKALAERWAKSLETLLPKATPCSKLPPEQLGYKANGKTVAAKPTAAQPPVKVASTKPIAMPVAKPAAAKPATAVVAQNRPVSTMTGGESGAMLLIVDALGTGRDMNDQDWAAQKESLAKNLYNDLSYYLTGKGTTPKLTVTAPVKPVAKPVAAKPVTVVTKPAAKPVTVVAKPTAAKPAAKPVAATKPAAKPVAATTKPVAKPVVAAVKPADASMVKVPQKNRIRAKFAAAKAPYDKIAASDPALAGQVSDMLAASRSAFAYGKFDESEKQVDAALAALGVNFKE